jgi:flagellar hook-length control protein FliK
MAGKPGLESLNPGASLAADGVGSPAVVAEMPSLQISDTMLADTVSYWVSQGVQNAELTLDGLGGEPIEVSIQLANGEALIGFRSDLAETRQLIEGAMTQLKDLLANQGLLLAGVSVGTSSRQDGSPGETPRRPGGRLRGVSLAETAMVQPAPRALGSVGQRLDLFV